MKEIKTYIKIKGVDKGYTAEGANATYEQMVRHCLSVIADEPLKSELEKRGYKITKEDK